jgi:protoporphyrinogen oxidase
MGSPAPKVLVLGAGPAGLAAALALGSAGWSAEVVELGSSVGGLARTVQHGGFRFDIGGHRWFSKSDELNRFVINLLGDELAVVDRSSKIYFQGKYVDYPLQATNVLTRMSPADSARAVGGFVASQALQRVTRKPIVSMEDAYVAQFGRVLYELFFRHYSEKVWGRECAELSGDWVVQRSKGLSLGTALRQVVTRTSGNVESLIGQFLYPRLGYGRISERMAEELVGVNGEIHLGWRVVAVEHRRGNIVRIRISDGRQERVCEADVIVSSIPMTELVQILEPALDVSVTQAAGALTFRDLITIHLMLDRPRVTADTWIYLQDSEIKGARLHEPRNWSAAMAPPGQTSLVLEYFCDAGDALWQRSDAELCALAVHEVGDKLRLIEAREVVDAFAIRSRNAYPRYDLQYRAAVETIKRSLAEFANLYLVGRGGTFRYNNTDHAIESGLLAARSILGEAVDTNTVNTEQTYLEERRSTPGRRSTK